MLLYGSIHAGSATPESDIDLCVVFDDIDYRHRPSICVEVENCAELKTGCPVDVRIADWPEWRGMSKCVSTFERHIIDHSRVIYERPPRGVEWGKSLLVLPTDKHLAVDALLTVLAQLGRLAAVQQERRSAEVGTTTWNRHSNELGALAQDIMEKSLVALHRAIPVPFPSQAKSVRHLIELVAPSEHCRSALVQATGFSEPEKAPSLQDLGDTAGLPPIGDVDSLVSAARAMASICAQESARQCARAASVRRVNRRIQRLLG